MAAAVIGVYIRGGLGNQMFQYAAGRAVALRLGASLGVELSWYDEGASRPYPQGRFPYQLGHFGIDAFSMTEEHAIEMDHQANETHDYVFDPVVPYAPDGSMLNGYWQSERYFDDYADQIRTDLPVPGPRFESVASLHVRQGTPEFPTDPELGMMTPAYYEEALEEILKVSLVEEVWVFADDVEWARDLRLQVPTYVMNGSGLGDFSLMSRCEHHIVANSSYSWWAAWLDPNPGKIVVAPRDFAEFPMPDFIPESWTTISCAP